MKEKLQFDKDSTDIDPVWDLLDKFSTNSRIEASPWFSAQTVAKTVGIPQRRSIFSPPSMLRRFLLPIPIAAAVALLMLAVHTGRQSGNSNHFVSTEDEFEQHMAMLISTD